ncbi:MAG: ABC transporter ATP-binding protein [Desulfovibrio sp.]|jgi:peptide/nickel transport system ATP-binding protein|nr:ABC transporter ATP-binding protein [Desulfovibrio sp.]
MSTPLLEVNSLCVDFHTRSGTTQAVRGISFSIGRGEFFCLVGESGSGKSVTGLTMMGLLENSGRVSSGSVSWRNEILLDGQRARSRWIRPPDMSMIFQYPMTALNPIRKAGRQICDVLQATSPGLSGREYKKQSLDLLDKVRIKDAGHCWAAYPFELSGGQCQRILIAMALAREPKLLIADEPTTGLDVVTQKAILDLLKDMTREGMGVFFITHDLGLAFQYSDRMAVMRYGQLLECGAPLALLNAPSAGYTRRLLASTPSLMHSLDQARGIPDEACP